MKIIKIGEPKVIMEAPKSRHDYFAWPTAARLKNGRIAVVASGFRLRHICPFGKTVISYSENEGETYTLPAPVIDTPLDDRDGGIMTFGESGVIVTSFNNTVDFQRNCISTGTANFKKQSNERSLYDMAYLDTVTPEEEAEALGVSFRISHDNGVTFGKIHKSPITSPHGPVELPDGSIIWVGRTFSSEKDREKVVDRIEAHKMNPDGSMEFIGAIDNIEHCGITPLLCEPHAIALKDGSLLAHIRVQCKGDAPLFTIFQSRSADGGKTWSKPRQILSDLGGSPPHLMRASDGTLICTYGYREEPYGIKAIFSCDEGESWEGESDIYVNGVNKDIGYPSTVELFDGSFITVFYAHRENGDSAAVMQQKWRIEK